MTLIFKFIPAFYLTCIQGLKNYGYDALADSIASRWLDLNMKVFFDTGKMMEKYDVVDISRPGGGGEYP